MQLATDKPEAAQKSYLHEDHSSLKLEEERDVKMAPSNLKKDNGVSFKEEDHEDIPTEEEVDVHLPDSEIEEKGETFIQSHVATDTAFDDDEDDGDVRRETSTEPEKLEIVQEVDISAGKR